MILAIASGGTGGHIIPALAVALAWQEKGYQAIWFGRKDGLEASVAKENNIPFVHIDAYGFGSIRKLPSRLQLISKSVMNSAKLLKEHKVSCVFSTGSFASFPTAMASTIADIPLIIHEQNTIVGLANKVLMPFAHKIYLGMPIAFLPKGWQVGNPLLSRPEPSSGEHLLIFAGSQGSHFINTNLPKLLLKLQCQLPIIHIAGSQKAEVEKLYQDLGLQAEVYDFVHNMDEVFRKTKLVLCRSGAMSLAEIMAYQIPAIIVPYPHAKRDHQRKNAQYAVSTKGAVMVEENVSELKSVLSNILSDPNQWMDMKKALQNQQYKDTTEIIVKGILKTCAQPLSH